MAASDQTHVPLTNGRGTMPIVGCGTWTLFGKLGSPEKLAAAIKAAIDVGFRHIDTAWVYGTESIVGEAIKEKVYAGIVKREDLFITTKLWDTHHNPSLVEAELLDSLRKLHIDYVDMYLIHRPTALQDSDMNMDNLVPYDKDGNVVFETNHRLEDVWKAMEGCYEAGLAKNIGLSNFNIKQTLRILDSCKVKPSNMQVGTDPLQVHKMVFIGYVSIEISPYHANKELRDFCKARGIVVTAHAPLGANSRPWKQEGEPDPYEEPLLRDIASARGKSVAQIFNFELSSEEMTQIASLNRNLRVYTEPITIGHPEYPFVEEL